MMDALRRGHRKHAMQLRAIDTVLRVNRPAECLVEQGAHHRGTRPPQHRRPTIELGEQVVRKPDDHPVTDRGSADRAGGSFGHMASIGHRL